MSLKENALGDFRMFPSITEAWELVKTGLVVIREQSYRLELWHSHSNLDIPYYVSIYTQSDGVWRRMPNPPFPVGLDGEQTLRAAMAFLSERVAA
jgi:hypothetical protein